jgi:hypothetical protein
MEKNALTVCDWKAFKRNELLLLSVTNYCKEVIMTCNWTHWKSISIDCIIAHFKQIAIKKKTTKILQNPFVNKNLVKFI